MKKVIRKAAVAALFAGSVLGAVSANAVNTNNNAAVRVLQALTVTANDDMNFGIVISPTTSGTVVVSNTGALSGTLTRLPGIPGSEGTALVTGDTANTVTVTVTDTTSEAGLALSNFTGTFGGVAISGGQFAVATIAGGSELIQLGATLTVDSTAPGYTTGDKTPTYDIDVQYD